MLTSLCRQHVIHELNVPYDCAALVKIPSAGRGAGSALVTCKPSRGLVWYSHTLGVCDAESYRRLRWQPSEPDLGNASVGKRHSICTDMMIEP